MDDVDPCEGAANKQNDMSDSGVDTDFTSDMESITSSNYDWKVRGSRRYLPVVPNRDITESLTIHTLFQTTMKKKHASTHCNTVAVLYLAPT
jgi:hypothetical protein